MIEHNFLYLSNHISCTDTLYAMELTCHMFMYLNVHMPCNSQVTSRVPECSHAMQLTGHISCTRMFTCHATHRSHLMYLNTLMPGSDMQLINLLSVTKISPTGLLPGTLPSPDRSRVMKNNNEIRCECMIIMKHKQ